MGWVGASETPLPACCPPLQLNQNLNDVLVGLEKQHGSNTFTVKAQPRWVMPRGFGGGGLRLPARPRRSLFLWSHGLGLSGASSLCQGSRSAGPLSPGLTASPVGPEQPGCLSPLEGVRGSVSHGHGTFW